MTTLGEATRSVAIGALARRIGRSGRSARRVAELAFALAERLPPGGGRAPRLADIAGDLKLSPSRLSHCLDDLRARGLLVETSAVESVEVVVTRKRRVRLWRIQLPGEGA